MALALSVIIRAVLSIDLGFQKAHEATSRIPRETCVILHCAWKVENPLQLPEDMEKTAISKPRRGLAKDQPPELREVASAV